MLYQRGISYEHCFDELNASRADLIQEIHREYIAAGADIIETNTFGANRIKLERFGLQDRVVELNRRAAKIAREARDIAGREVWVAGSIGPIGKPSAPTDERSRSRVAAAFREQMEGLLEGGVDGFMLETFWDLGQMLDALAAARSVCALPVSRRCMSFSIFPVRCPSAKLTKSASPITR